MSLSKYLIAELIASGLAMEARCNRCERCGGLGFLDKDGELVDCPDCLDRKMAARAALDAAHTGEVK